MLLSPVNLTLVTHISHTKLTFHFALQISAGEYAEGAQETHPVFFSDLFQRHVSFFISFFFFTPFVFFQQLCFESSAVLNVISGGCTMIAWAVFPHELW